MGLFPPSALLPHNPSCPAFRRLFKTRLIAFRLCYRPRYQPKIGDQRSLVHFSPISWENVVLYGEYRLRPELVTGS